MSAKTNTQVVIGGRMYTVSGYESEAYLQQVAAYLNNKLAEFDQMQTEQLDEGRFSDPGYAGDADAHAVASVRQDLLQQRLELVRQTASAWLGEEISAEQYGRVISRGEWCCLAVPAAHKDQQTEKACEIFLSSFS